MPAGISSGKIARQLSALGGRTKTAVHFGRRDLGPDGLMISPLHRWMIANLIQPGVTIAGTGLVAGEQARRILYQEHLADALVRGSAELNLPVIVGLRIEPIRFLDAGTKTPWSAEGVAEAVYMQLAAEMAALAARPYLGLGKGKPKDPLRAVKEQLDRAAAEGFTRVISTRSGVVVETSEATDHGEVQPGVPIQRMPQDPKFQIAVDPVDGTTMAAKGENGAISIAALAPALPTWRGVPNIQALAAIVPSRAAGQVTRILKTISGPVEGIVRPIVSEIARAQDKAPADLRIMTHGVTNSTQHQATIEAIKKTGAVPVVPAGTTIESPYALGSYDVGRAHIDGAFGVFGAPETVISTIQLQCLSGGGRGMDLLFRPASNTPLIQNKGGRDLRMIFDFTGQEQAEMADCGIVPDRVYSFADIGGKRGQGFASLVSVTDNDLLGLRGVRLQAGRLFSQGLLLDPLGNVFGIAITRQG